MKNNRTVTIDLLLSILLFGLSCTAKLEMADTTEPVTEFRVNPSTRFQTIHNFGASDAWAIQMVGEYWPVASREKISDLLFSVSDKADGSPEGIGLSAWRFNIGAGSAEQGAASQIKDEWRRAACFLDENGNYDWDNQVGQQWFLKAAQQRGVNDFIGFVNSPPVVFTKNGKAWSDDGLASNLKEEHYDDYAEFLAKAVKNIATHSGVHFDYISPFNEPQWEWKCCKQEGSPWNNDEIAKATRAINQAFRAAQLEDVKIELPEAAQIDYLYQTKSSGKRSNQITAFFDPASENYLGDLEYVAPKVAAHSYFTTWGPTRLVELRSGLWTNLKAVNPDLEFWMSEYFGRVGAGFSEPKRYSTGNQYFRIT